MPTTAREIRLNEPPTKSPCARCYSSPATYVVVIRVKGKKQNSIRKLTRCKYCMRADARRWGLELPT